MEHVERAIQQRNAFSIEDKLKSGAGVDERFYSKWQFFTCFPFSQPRDLISFLCTVKNNNCGDSNSRGE